MKIANGKEGVPTRSRVWAHTCALCNQKRFVCERAYVCVIGLQSEFQKGAGEPLEIACRLRS